MWYPTLSPRRGQLYESDISARWDREGDEAPIALTSIEYPNYHQLNEAETAYYFYWRSMVRKGKYLRSCKGFLHLFTCEIINNDDDPKENLRMLTNVVKVYGGLDRVFMDSVADCCFTYAKLHKLDDPKMDRGCEWPIVAYRMTECLSEDPIAPIPVKIAMQFLRGVDMGYVDDEHPYGEMLTQALRDIESMERRGPGTRLIDAMGVRTKVQYDVYVGFEYFGDRRRATVDTLKFSSDSSAKRFMRATFSTLLFEVRTRERESAPNVVEYPARYRSVIRRVIDQWRTGEWKPEDLEPETFRLDRKSVKRAEMDLDAVSEMMATEEEEESAPVAEEKKDEVSDDPWKALASSLDDTEKGYLEAALEGKGKQYARSNGLRLTAIEEPINAKAMDHVNDIVVEDGTVICDYEQEIRGMYRWMRRTYRRGHS